MKKNFTLFKCIVLSTLLLTNGWGNQIQAQSCTAPQMSWVAPTLVSGTANSLNAVYRFNNVIPGVYAHVIIIDIVNGASLTNIDNTANGYSAAWQPMVKTPSAQVASDSWVSFRIEFYRMVDNFPHSFPCFQLSFIDIDGDNSSIREFVATKNHSSYTVAGNTTLTMSQVNAFTQATGDLFDYPGIDTSAHRTNVNFIFTNRQNVPEVRIGNRVNASHSVTSRYSCGYFAPITIPYTPLPLKYLSFDALVANNAVTLKWLTTQEVNTSHFEVERSFDNANFKTIGLVMDGITVNASDKRYEYKDLAAELKNYQVLYYRLKQFDKDGKFTYSKIIAVKIQPKADVTMQVSPNPFVEAVSVRFNSTENGNAQIRIMNLAGQTVLSKQSIISKGYNNVQIDGLSKLASGTYIAQMILNGVVIDKQRIIKVAGN